jgi:hypothetical protein
MGVPCEHAFRSDIRPGGGSAPVAVLPHNFEDGALSERAVTQSERPEVGRS